MLIVDLHITGRLLIGMGKKLKFVHLCSHAPAHKHSKELMWYTVHNSSSKARSLVFLTCQHEGYSVL